MISPPRLDALFHHGRRHRWPEGAESRLDVVQVADLNLTTGMVVTRDPADAALGALDTEAFTTSVAPGQYAVTLSLARWPCGPPDDAARGAAVMVSIRDEPVQEWELALLADQDPSTLGDEEFFGFCVDSRSGCVLDVAALPFLRELQASSADMDIAEEVLRNNYAVATDESTGMNIIFFDCGMEHGAYPTWIGRTAHGDVACFVVDFELLDHAEPVDG